MAGNGALFTREDSVEAAWAIVDPVLDNHHRAHPYEPGTWGPEQADRLIIPHGRWHDLMPAEKESVLVTSDGQAAGGQAAARSDGQGSMSVRH
jgi:hypothetical protein